MAIPIIASLGATVGEKIAGIFGGGPSAKELNLRSSRADGHAAGSGDVSAVAKLLSAAQYSKYPERRQIGLAYLVELANGKGYQGRTATLAVQTAAKAALKTMGASTTNGLLSNGAPLVPNTGNGTFANNNPSSQPTGIGAPTGAEAGEVGQATSVAPLWWVAGGVGALIVAKKFKLI